MYDIADRVALRIAFQLEFRNVNFYKTWEASHRTRRTDRYGIRTPTTLALGGRRASTYPILSCTQLLRMHASSRLWHNWRWLQLLFWLGSTSGETVLVYARRNEKKKTRKNLINPPYRMSCHSTRWSGMAWHGMAWCTRWYFMIFCHIMACAML